MNRALPEQVLIDASSSLGKTKSNFTYRKMTDFFVSKGNELGYNIPIREFNLENSPTKRNAIKQNLNAFRDERIQFDLILELCERKEFEDDDSVKKLKDQLIRRFGYLRDIKPPTIKETNKLYNKGSNVKADVKNAQSDKRQVTTKQPSTNQTKQKKSFNPGWLIFLVALITLIFGTNLYQRYFSNDNNGETEIKVNQEVQLTNSTETKIDTINLKYLNHHQLIDQNLNIGHFYNDLSIGGINFSKLLINGTDNNGNKIDFRIEDNSIRTYISSNPRIELNYLGNFYDVTTTGRVYNYTTIISKIDTNTIELYSVNELE